MRTFLLLIALLFARGAVAQTPAASEEVFGKPPSAEAQNWLNSAVEAYNEKMSALKRDWLVNVSGARTDIRRRQVIFETANGDVGFDAKVIGGFGRKDDKWVWMWGWDSPTVAANFRLPSALLADIGSTMGLPFLTTARFYSASADLPFLIGAVVLKVNGGVGVHRVRSGSSVEPYDVYYLLSDPRRVEK